MPSIVPAPPIDVQLSGPPILTDAEIAWTLPALPRIEFAELPPTYAELAAYTYDLQGDCEAIRLVLSEALAAVARLTGQADTSRDRIAALTAEVRRLAADNRALHARLRQEIGV